MLGEPVELVFEFPASKIKGREGIVYGKLREKIERTVFTTNHFGSLDGVLTYALFTEWLPATVYARGGECRRFSTPLNTSPTW